MGAWGTGIFDNDTACDWAYDLKETSDLSLLYLRNRFVSPTLKFGWTCPTKSHTSRFA
jgi:hypothetical protein